MGLVVKTAQRENEVVACYTGDAYCNTGVYDSSQLNKWEKADISKRIEETHLESITGQNRTFVVVDTIVNTNMLITVKDPWLRNASTTGDVVRVFQILLSRREKLNTYLIGIECLWLKGVFWRYL